VSPAVYCAAQALLLAAGFGLGSIFGYWLRGIDGMGPDDATRNRDTKEGRWRLSDAGS